MKELFEKLLQQVDPDKKLLSEEKKQELIKDFETKVSQLKEQAFNEALQTVDEDHSAKLEKVIGMITEQDEDHATKLQTIVEAIDEDHTTKMKTIVESLDEDHTTKMKSLVEKIDEDHASKMEKVIAKVNEDLTKKMNDTIAKINEDNDTKLADKLSDYLDTYLKEAKPEDVIVNESRLRSLEKMYSGLRELVFVNDKLVQEEVKEALVDAKKIMDEKDKALADLNESYKKEVNKLMLEKVELNHKFKNIEAETLLEQKTKDCSPKLKGYLEARFKKATTEDIEKQFVEAVEAFNKEEKANRDRLIEEAKARQPKITPVAIKEEKTDDGKPVVESKDNRINGYVGLINKFNKK